MIDALRSWSARLDDAQASHPIRYNLATGALTGAVLVALGFGWWILVLYAVSWTVVRAALWRPGGVLRRQYEQRRRRVAERERGIPV